MNQTNKTIAFISVGAVLAILAVATNYMTQPKPVTDFEKVGMEFFESFQDPSVAKSLEVVALDEEKNIPREFKVEFKDGLWRIPSHHDYPAEAADRLAKTASSLIGLRRESLVARRDTQHEEYGVIDPSGDEAKDAESTGKRITFRDADGEILADYIIGDPAGSIEDDNENSRVSGAVDDDYYYVRVPGEKETYKTEVNIDLSTKFADWIEPDLLKLEKGKIRKLDIDNYRLEKKMVNSPQGFQIQHVKVVGQVPKLSRDGEFDPWKLEDMNEETEEIDTTKIDEIVNLLDDMTIVGVRPKLKHDGQLLLTSDLTLNRIPSLVQNPQLFSQLVRQLQVELEDKGFAIGAEDEQAQNVTLVGKRGELTASTEEGVVYTLYFGEVFLGDESSIEIGGNESPVESESDDEAGDDTEEKKTESKTVDPADAADQATGDEEKSDEENSDDGRKKSRFVAIRVKFDPDALGDKPLKPTEPAKPTEPEGYQAWKAEKEKAEKEKADQEKADQEKADQEKADQEKADQEKADQEKADQGKGGEDKADQGKADQEKADQDKAKASDTGNSKEQKQSDADNAKSAADGGGQSNQDDGQPTKNENQDKESDSDSSTEQTKDDAPKPPDDIAAATDEKFETYEQQLEEYNSEKSKYDSDLTQYQTDQSDYEKREMAGKEQAKELNERFAEWYYVVPSESVAKLKLARTDLVKPKKSDPPLEAPVSPGEQNLPPTPDINFPPKDQSDSDNPDNANKTTEKKSSDPKDKPSTNEQKKVDKSEEKSEDKSNG